MSAISGGAYLAPLPGETGGVSGPLSISLMAVVCGAAMHFGMPDPDKISAPPTPAADNMQRSDVGTPPMDTDQIWKTRFVRGSGAVVGSAGLLGLALTAGAVIRRSKGFGKKTQGALFDAAPEEKTPQKALDELCTFLKNPTPSLAAKKEAIDKYASSHESVKHAPPFRQ